MPATIFSGDKVKALKSKLKLGEGAEVISTTVDPTTGAGLAAPIGTIVLNETSGAMYQKTGALDTDWVVASLTGALSTSGGTMNGDITFASGFGDLTSGGLVAGKLINVQLLTATTSSTYTPTAGTRLIRVAVCGGGGGSGGTIAATSSTCTASAFGGDGGFVYFIAKVTDATGTYQCGAAGAAGSSSPGAGGTGGTTTFSMGAGGASINVSCAGGTAGGAGTDAPFAFRYKSQFAAGTQSISGANIIYSKTRSLLGLSSCFGYVTTSFKQAIHHRIPSEFSKIYIGAGTELVKFYMSSSSSSSAIATNPEYYGVGGSGRVNFLTSTTSGNAGIQGAIYIEEYA